MATTPWSALRNHRAQTTLPDHVELGPWVLGACLASGGRRTTVRDPRYTAR